jgi:iron complex transport system ATP-binding protein
MSRLVASGLSVARDDDLVVDDVSVAIEPGAITAIVGPNGAGKSSLLAALAGLLPARGGRVLLDGRPLAAIPLPERARAIGWLAQSPALHWGLRVEEVVALGRHPHRGAGGLSASDRAAIDRAIQQADLQDFVGRRADLLSGGERARVLAARLIAGEPRVILADEPLANLDPLHQAQLALLFRRLADDGVAVALVLHDLTAAARLADRALLMAGGRLMAAGPAAEVLGPGPLATLFGVAIDRVETPGGPGLLPGAPLG